MIETSSSWEILAGPPGTGKTTELLRLMQGELDRGVPPDRIGYISFTRKAAQEASERACEKFSLKKTDLPWIRTIHSLCFAALGMSSSDILEGRKLVEFGDWVGVPVTGSVSGDEGSTFGSELGDRCLFMENLARVRGVTLREQYDYDDDDIPWAVVERVERGLAEFKKARSLMDFTDLLSSFAASEWTARLQVLFVDEAQDLSLLQWRVVERLARGAERVVIAGDDDQAIYRWAGAAVEHFVALPGTARVLEQSYRVPSSVQDVALGLVGRLTNRRQKAWRPRTGDAGVLARVASLDDALIDTSEETLILARNLSFLRDDAAPMLRQSGVLYEQKGVMSVSASVVGAILDWERLRRGLPVPAGRVRKIYEQMVSGEGYTRGHKKLPGFPDDETEVTTGDLVASGGLIAGDVIWRTALSRIPVADQMYMVRALKHGDKLTERPTTRLSTIHGSKGGEADHVVLYTDMAYRTFREMDKWPEDELRSFYVAVTRAKKKLTIIRPGTRRSFDL